MFFPYRMTKRVRSSEFKVRSMPYGHASRTEFGVRLEASPRGESGLGKVQGEFQTISTLNYDLKTQGQVHFAPLYSPPN